MKKSSNFAPAKIQQGSLRLSVRTRDFHSLKSSSTLLWATKIRVESKESTLFLFKEKGARSLAIPHRTPD